MTTMSEQDQFSNSCGDDGSSGSVLIENLPQKKIKNETKCEEIGPIDRINQLSDALIIKILSLLSITDAFRTTILSKHWQYFWTSIYNIVYDNEQYGRSNHLKVHKFISLTDKVLPLLSCSTIKKFNLNFVFKYADEVSYFPKIDKWLEFAVNKKVEDLCLNIRYTIDPTKHDQTYALPELLCCSSSLQKLKCNNCRILEDCVLNWTSLKSLTLESLFLRDEHIKQIMSNCPQLEFLKIHGFYGFNRLHMTSPKCKRLQLIDHDHLTGDWYSFEGDGILEIVAPYVEHLMISGVFNHTKIKLVDLSSLNHAILNLCCDRFDEMDGNIVKDLLVSVCHANELILSSWFIKPYVVSQQKKSSMTTMSEQDQFSNSCGDDGSSGSVLIENLSQKKIKNETKCEDIGPIDRISQLSDALIIKILSLLSITDAFKTTILSKHWQYFWTSIDNIVYDNEQYGRSDHLTVHKFISLMDKVLPILSCSTIKKFSLNFVFKYADDVSYFPKIDKWLEFAVNKIVEDLCLNIRYTIDPTKHDQTYALPELLCYSSSLQKLRCNNCRILEDCVLNWTSLKSLTLESLFLRDEHIKQIMSNCPQLDFLKIRGFYGFNRLHMTSPKCKRLQLIDHDHLTGDWYSFEGDGILEIVTQYVEHLMISGVFNHTKIKLVDLSCLNHAILKLCCDGFDEMDGNIVKDLLVSVCHATELILSSWFIKVISNLMLEEEDVFLPLFECRSLTISSCISKHSFPILDILLRSTSNLENLMIFPDVPYDPIFESEDIDLLEDYYLSFQENIFKVSLKNLKNVKVMPFCGHFHESRTTKLDQFLKFLLEHAINLEKLVIVPEHKGCNNCSTNISTLLKCLLHFPRASNGATISFRPVTQNVFLQ